jgi:hypothetical protein
MWSECWRSVRWPYRTPGRRGRVLAKSHVAAWTNVERRPPPAEAAGATRTPQPVAPPRRGRPAGRAGGLAPVPRGSASRLSQLRACSTRDDQGRWGRRQGRSRQGRLPAGSIPAGSIPEGSIPAGAAGRVAGWCRSGGGERVAAQQDADPSGEAAPPHGCGGDVRAGDAEQLGVGDGSGRAGRETRYGGGQALGLRRCGRHRAMARHRATWAGSTLTPLPRTRHHPKGLVGPVPLRGVGRRRSQGIQCAI